MNAADVELARMVYLASSLGVLLFTSIILRGLWRPLRFLLLAVALSVMFTPFFVQQDMPDGSKQNILPAFVVMLHDGINDRDNWRQAIRRAGTPIMVVTAVTGIIALALAFLLPKPVKAAPVEKTEKPENRRTKKKRNPYLPEDFQPD